MEGAATNTCWKFTHTILKSASERTINELVEINTEEDCITCIAASWLEEMSPMRTRNR